MSKSKENPNKDRKTFIACFKEQIDYFVNSFSDLSPYKKIGSECCDNGKPCFFKQKNTDGEPIFEDEDGVEYDSFTYDLIVKLNSLKEITVNSRDIFEELDIEDLIRTVSMVIALYNRYYSDYKSDKPEYKNKFTHNSIYRNYGDFCVLFNALMSEIEYERIGIDTAKSMPEPAPILEHKRNIIGSIFQKMIECIKTHTIYINFVESRKVHYGDYYKNRVRL
jgi:hypothetical protein